MSCVARYCGQHDGNGGSDNRRTHGPTPPFRSGRRAAAKTRLSFGRSLGLALLLDASWTMQAYRDRGASGIDKQAQMDAYSQSVAADREHAKMSLTCLA